MFRLCFVPLHLHWYLRKERGGVGWGREGGGGLHGGSVENCCVVLMFMLVLLLFSGVGVGGGLLSPNTSIGCFCLFVCLFVGEMSCWGCRFVRLCCAFSSHISVLMSVWCH